MAFISLHALGNLDHPAFPSVAAVQNPHFHSGTMLEHPHHQKSSNEISCCCGCCLRAAVTPTWVARVTPRLCPWTARAACTTAPSSTSCSTPSASTTNSVAPTGTITSVCCGRTSSQVGARESNTRGGRPGERLFQIPWCAGGAGTC